MRANFRIFLINLDRSPARLQFMSAQAAQHGLTFERIRAVDGLTEIPTWLKGQFDAASGMSDGEIGCYASHLGICALIKEQKIPAAIVLEDDALLDPDFAETCQSAIASAPAGWDIIHLSTQFKRQHYPISPFGNGRSLVRYTRLPSNSAAYAISAAGAAKLLNSGSRCRPYDLEFRYAWIRDLDVVGVYPPPARQHTDIPSTINAKHHGGAARGSMMRAGKSTIQKAWQPGFASQAYGRLFVMRRLGVVGTLYCWRNDFTRKLNKTVKFATAAGRGDRRPLAPDAL
jgi:glycosyl transferase, family 25